MYIDTRDRDASGQGVRQPAPATSYLPPDNLKNPPKSVKMPDGSKWVYKKRKRFLPLKIFLALLLVLIIAAVVAVNLYIWEFNSRIESHQSSVDTIHNVLTPAEEGKPYYILLLGSDSREGSGTSTNLDMMGDNQRSDVMVLVRVDEEKNQLTLLSIPRDTPWHHDNTVQKINETYNIGRAALTTEVVSKLVGLPISHVIEIKFSGLQGLVDALGGVDVDVPVEISYKDALTGEEVVVPAGKQHLTGQQAQIFARVRKAYKSQDAVRQSNVRQLGNAILKSIKDHPITEWPELGLKLADCVGSDMRFNDFVKLMLGLTDGDEDITMFSGTGPTAGTIDEATQLWLCYDDPEGWKEVAAVVDAGEDPAEISAKYLTDNIEEPVPAEGEEQPVVEGEYDPGWTDGYVEEPYVDYGAQEYVEPYYDENAGW